jgi:protein phosphatase
MQMDLEPDTHQFPWQPGDRVLLCTDGLSGLVNDDEMRDIALEEADPQDACQRLLDLAMERGGYDNITIVLVQLPA